MRTQELAAFWMPFTGNRLFKQGQAPRVFESAEGFHYKTPEGRLVLDSFSGMWTSGLGHCHPQIVAAVQRQVAKLDYAPVFQMAHTGVIELANRLVGLAPDGFDHAFFTTSGSEAVDTALKIALGYHRMRGEGTRTRFIGRQRSYHGVNFGGSSVGGLPLNRALFSDGLLPRVSHLPHTHSPEHNAFSRGQPQWGGHLADELEGILALHGPENVAAVIVEPVAGSGGVLPPPTGYLQRLREICSQHGVLLIFDEVITAFCRIGALFGSERFGVMPDLIATAKGITNGVVPMGAVLVGSGIYDAFMQGAGQEHMVEFFHGYTYSGHPLACAAALAALEVYEQEDMPAAALGTEKEFEAQLHALRDARHVIDIRNFGLMGAVDLEPRPGAPGARGLETHAKCFADGVIARNGMDTLQFSPFFKSTPEHFEQIFGAVRKALATVD